jgi:N-carbamoyl-L-amino-acid hydrolase
MIASGVFAGVFGLDQAWSCADTEGKTLGEELSRIGYVGDADVGARPVHAFFELHIEQGPILEDEGFDIGVVTHAQGVRWYEINLTGMESHAGPTPMLKRKDALLGAARIVELVNEIGLNHLPGACATAGMIEVHPNSRNVIPGRAFLTVDLRHPEEESLAAMDAALAEGVAQIARDTHLDYELKELFYFPPLAFDRSCIAAIRGAAERLGYRHRDIVSGAGHDACYLARVAPTAMVFSPCVDGISHNEGEDCKPEWVTASANVLMHAVLDKAGIIDTTK